MICISAVRIYRLPEERFKKKRCCVDPLTAAQSAFSLDHSRDKNRNGNDFFSPSAGSRFNK